MTFNLFAETELQRMNIAFNKLTLIRDKDGVSVWRVTTENNSFVMKCFEKQEYRREIANYKILGSLGVPTLKMIAHTDCSLLIEDIANIADIKISIYRLGTLEDLNNPNIASKIALWYKTLHKSGREYLNTHDFIDEYDCLTLENFKIIQEKTGTGDLEVWLIIEKYFEQIHSAVMNLPRTLVYTDFHFTNLAVACDNSSALIFDYNFFFKSYVYSDIRNVCRSLGNEESKTAFLSVYGEFDELEIVVDDVSSILYSLNLACQRKIIPNWVKDNIEKLKDGRLLTAVKKLLENA